VILLISAIAGGLVASGLASPALLLPIDLALEAVLGLAARLVVTAVPAVLSVTFADANAAAVTEVSLAAVPVLALIGMALIVRASTLVRRVISVAAALASLGAYTWMDGWQATMAVSVIMLVAAAVAMGTKFVVSVPLALLSGALVVRTALHVWAGMPAVGVNATQMVSAFATPDDAVLNLAKWAVLVTGTGIAMSQWRKAL
jgi:hypothetical protein